MYSPRAHPGPPSPMDSKILIKPLSLWPEYSTGGLLIFAKKRKSLGAVTLRDFLYPHTLSGASSTIHSTVRKMVTSWPSWVRTTLLWWRRGELNSRPKTHSQELLRAQAVIAEDRLLRFPFQQASRHARRSGKLHDSWYAQSLAYTRAPLNDA